MSTVAYIAPRRWVRLKRPDGVVVIIAPDQDGWAAWLITRDCAAYPLDHHPHEHGAQMDADSFAALHDLDVVAIDYPIGRFLAGDHPPGSPGRGIPEGAAP